MSGRLVNCMTCGTSFEASGDDPPPHCPRCATLSRTGRLPVHRNWSPSHLDRLCNDVNAVQACGHRRTIKQEGS